MAVGVGDGSGSEVADGVGEGFGIGTGLAFARRVDFETDPLPAMEIGRADGFDARGVQRPSALGRDFNDILQHEAPIPSLNVPEFWLGICPWTGRTDKLSIALSATTISELRPSTPNTSAPN